MPRFNIMMPREMALPQELREDVRVQILGELPGLCLIESDDAVANDWARRLPQLKFLPERSARLPDPRPKLKRPL